MAALKLSCASRATLLFVLFTLHTPSGSAGRIFGKIDHSFIHSFFIDSFLYKMLPKLWPAPHYCKRPTVVCCGAAATRSITFEVCSSTYSSRVAGSLRNFLVRLLFLTTKKKGKEDPLLTFFPVNNLSCRRNIKQTTFLRFICTLIQIDCQYYALQR